MLLKYLQTWNGCGVPDLMWPRTDTNNITVGHQRSSDALLPFCMFSHVQ